MTLRPFDDRVLIAPIEAAEESPGGIFIPDNARDRPQQGEVLAVGPGLRRRKDGTRRPCEVKVGDRVLYGLVAGWNEVEIDGRELLLFREAELFCVIDKRRDDGKR